MAKVSYLVLEPSSVLRSSLRSRVLRGIFLPHIPPLLSDFPHWEKCGEEHNRLAKSKLRSDFPTSPTFPFFRSVEKEREKKKKSQRKISGMLGERGKWMYNHLVPSDLCVSPSFGRVGEELGMSWGSGGNVGEVGVMLGKWG
jgi:hypothetical protein